MTVGLIEGQRRRDRTSALQSDGVGANEIALGSLQFVGGNAILGHRLQFLSDGAHGFFYFLGAGGHVDGKVARIHSFQRKGTHPIGQGSLLANLAEQAAPLPGQDMRQHFQGKAIGIGEGHARKAEHHVRLLLGQELEDLAWPFGGWLSGDLGLRHACFGGAGEECRDLGDHAVGLHVTHHRESQVLDRIVATKVLQQLAPSEPRHRFRRAERIEAIGMLLPHAGMEQPKRHLTQVVLLGADVVDDNSPLLVQLLVGERGVEQAVRHQVEATLEIAREKLGLQSQTVAARIA